MDGLCRSSHCDLGVVKMTFSRRSLFSRRRILRDHQDFYCVRSCCIDPVRDHAVVFWTSLHVGVLVHALETHASCQLCFTISRTSSSIRRAVSAVRRFRARAVVIVEVVASC